MLVIVLSSLWFPALMSLRSNKGTLRVFPDTAPPEPDSPTPATEAANPRVGASIVAEISASDLLDDPPSLPLLRRVLESSSRRIISQPGDLAVVAALLVGTGWGFRTMKGLAASELSAEKLAFIRASVELRKFAAAAMGTLAPPSPRSQRGSLSSAPSQPIRTDSRPLSEGGSSDRALSEEGVELRGLVLLYEVVACTIKTASADPPGDAVGAAAPSPSLLVPPRDAFVAFAARLRRLVRRFVAVDAELRVRRGAGVEEAPHSCARPPPARPLSGSPGPLGRG